MSMPIHPRTGLRAIGFGRRGPIWPVVGGSEPAPADAPATESGDKSAASGSDARTFTQADVDKIVGDRLARARDQYKDYDALKVAADELKQLKDGQKSDLEKATAASDELKSKLAEAESARQAAELTLRRRERAADKGLTDPKLVKRVTGSTDEEIDADIAELLEVQGGSRRSPLPNPQQGKPSQGKSGSVQAGRARYESRYAKNK